MRCALLAKPGFQISEFHQSRLSFSLGVFEKPREGTIASSAQEPHTEVRVDAPVTYARLRCSRSPRAIVDLALGTLLLVHPPCAMSADEKYEAAAALPEGDAEFTPTLWSVNGPTETN